MNDFIEAAKNSGNSDEDSEKRYNDLKKEEAGTEKKDPVKERYEELKDKAKKEYRKEEKKRMEREEEEDNEDENDEFVTY